MSTIRRFILLSLAAFAFVTYLLYGQDKITHTATPFNNVATPQQSSKLKAIQYSNKVNQVQDFRNFFSKFPVSTTQHHREVVLYNRVSKCGSSTMIWLGHELAKLNRFNFRSESYLGLVMNFSAPEKEQFAKRISKYGQDAYFIRHFHFFNFQEYGQKLPVFINVVREPVDRFISRFYYRRYGFVAPKKSAYYSKKQQEFPPERFNMTIEDCVFGGVEECLVKENYKPVLTFFCDDSSYKCMELSEYSLRRAMKNAASYYTSIGLTEDFNNTLKVFTALLPRYFRGAEKLLPMNPETKRTKSKNRLEPGDDVKAVLRKALRIDIEFYEFVKKRFYRQLSELKKLGRIVDDDG